MSSTLIQETNPLSHSSCSSPKLFNKESQNHKAKLFQITNVQNISELLLNICEENKQKIEKAIKKKIQIPKNISKNSLRNFIIRIAKHLKIHDSTMILTLIYIDRMCNNNNITISYNNIFQLVLTSLLIAIKYNEEKNFSFKYYATLGGVTAMELKILEKKFLYLINYNLYVDQKIFEKYNKDISSLDEGKGEQKYND